MILSVNISITHDISLTDALFGLLAISIVSNDKIISESVLKELNKCQIYSTDIFYWIGAYHELSGNNKAARTSYLKSCHQFPTSLTSWNHLLRFFLKTEPESAIFARRSLNSILDSYRFPEKVDIYIENLYLEGSYLFCIGSIDDSRKILTKAFHLQPENPKILASLYLCQTTDTGRNHISQNLEILKDQGSKEAIDLLARIRLHFDENNLKEAKSIIAHLENSQDNDANLDMSILFYYLGDYERALASINKYLNKCSSINGLEVKYCAYK
jgi:tetratricopeptide (TPR) repeat protein